MIRSTLLLSLASGVLAVTCTGGSTMQCPATGSFNVCAGDSLQANYIIRCSDGCPIVGNCNDNLAGVPPIGVKFNALCWQSSATAGDAQCTFDCVSVIRADGTSFYPVGCSSASSGSSKASSMQKSSIFASSKPSSASMSGSGGNSSPTPSGSSVMSSKFGGSSLPESPKASRSFTTSAGSGGSNGNEGGGGGIKTSLHVFTSTLAGGSVTTGTSTVVGTFVPAATVTSNVANFKDVQGMLALGMVGLIALV